MQFIDQQLAEAIENGNFSFAHSPGPYWVALIVVAIIVLVWFTYRKTTRALSWPWKTFFITTRSAVLIILLVCLMRPVITTYQVSPQQTYLAVLIDDSQSMSIKDQGGGESRSAAVADLLYSNNGLLESLGDSFQIRTFRFDKETQRISAADNLLESGTASSMGQALTYVSDQLSGLALGAVVLLSDGADNSDTDPVPAAENFGARKIPVFTVGVGQENIPQDVGIVDVRAARTVLEGSIFVVEVAINHSGYEGQEIYVAIVDGEQEVASKTVLLGTEDTTQRIELELTPDRPERIVYELQIDEQAGEIILQNNSYRFLVDNSEKPPLDILYIEGHPRNEYKFIHRAIQGDDSLRLVTYLQTGPAKFYRQGIKSPTELSGGFPDKIEDLFEYEAIIFGDISKSFFSKEQLEMVREFVSTRGGGFLLSGMMEAEFIGSPIADILPLTLVAENFLPQHLRGGIRRGSHATGELYYPQLTIEGEYSALLRLHSDDSKNLQLWRQLPELQGVYVTGRAKPGATVLIQHPTLQFQNQPLPIVATQRYGRGRSMNITSASTWRWQMLLPSDDDSHERLWRQMLRWLAVSAPDRISVEFDREFYNIGDEVKVTVTILDENYEPSNNESLWMQKSDPVGGVLDTPMEWDIDEDGVYRASFEVEEEGVYSLLIDVASAAGSTSRNNREKQVAFVVTPSLREYSNAGLDASLLERIALASGGKYYNVDAADQLVRDIEYTPNAYSREVQYDLWNTPWVLLLLILLLCVDWIARRFRGLS